MFTDKHERRTYIDGFLSGVLCTVVAFGVILGFFLHQWYSLIHRQ